MSAELPVTEDVNSIMPESGTVVLSDGTTVKIVRLKARQFFKMLRIVTRGAAHLLATLVESSTESLVEQLGAILLFAIPEAEQEAIEFIWSVIDLEGVDEKKVGYLRAAFDNPEIEDVLAVIEGIVANEAPEIDRLGKRFARLMQVAQKTGQTTKTTSQSQDSLPEPSISSQASTDGQTAPSSTSPLEESTTS